MCTTPQAAVEGTSPATAEFARDTERPGAPHGRTNHLSITIAYGINVVLRGDRNASGPPKRLLARSWRAHSLGDGFDSFPKCFVSTGQKKRILVNCTFFIVEPERRTCPGDFLAQGSQKESKLKWVPHFWTALTPRNMRLKKYLIHQPELVSCRDSSAFCRGLRGI